MAEPHVIERMMNTATAPRILIVGDEQHSRNAIERVLNAASFEVLEAATGREAIDVSHTEVPDLLIMDVNLASSEGFEGGREWLKVALAAHVPILHLSSTLLTDADRARALDSGADACLTHPLDPALLVSTLRSVLRAHQTERGVFENEARFRAVFERAQHGICLLDHNMAFVDVNPATCAILALTKEELIGATTRDFDYEELDEALAQRGRWKGVLPHLADDGHLQMLEWSVSMHSEEGLRLALVTDVTESRLIDDERERLLLSERAARAQAERSARLKDDYLATLSHELRTPLNSIVGWTHLLQTMQRSGDLPKGLEIIRRNANLQAQLITDMLDLTRISAGKLALDLQPVDPLTILQSAVESIRPLATAKGISVHLNSQGDVGHVSGDAARLLQVFWNLLQNALKVTPDNGNISVSAERGADGVEIGVADEGAGILPESLPHIFERFRQDNAGAVRTHVGNSLGLALVEQLVELHGGRVRASSSGVGPGASFVVSLPCIDTTRGAESSNSRNSTRARSDEYVDLHGMRVLVVDDDGDARSFVCRILGEHGAEVQDAGDVDSALNVIQSFSPRVLISDIGMPVQDGYDLIRQARREGLSAIALTAYERDDDRKRALDAGFDLHLTKPIDPLVLLEAVRSLVSPLVA